MLRRVTQDATAEFADSPAFYWSIVLLDLGVVVPATLLAAAAVHRRQRLGQHASTCFSDILGNRLDHYAVIGWFAMVPPSDRCHGRSDVRP